MKDELLAYDGVGLGELIRGGEITPLELLETVIARIEKIDPKINAVICKTYELAGKTARMMTESNGKANGIARGYSKPDTEMPLFYGVPFLLKNLLADCRDTPLNDGSRAVHGHISKLDSELVKRCKAAGLVIAGKTNSSEFGIMPAAEPALYGPTNNPWNPEWTPGGSSGGSAAAVAAGIVPMAHANDGGGSLRIPASCCGLFGLKPTRARNPLGPLFGDFAGGIAHEHAVTVTVRDSAALLDCTAGPDIGDPYPAPPPDHPYLEDTDREPGKLRIGFVTKVPEGWNEETSLNTDCRAAVEDAATLCETLGHKVEEVDADVLSWPGLPQTFVTVFASFVGHAIDYWERTLKKKITKRELEPATWELYRESLKISGGAYLAAWENLQLFSRKVAGWYAKGSYDILATPTMRIPPVRTGAFTSSPDDPMGWISHALSFVCFTRTQNITGQPAMSVPLFWTKENMPIGVQFAGRYGGEATLFRLAGQLEQARPWKDKKPPLHCRNIH